MPVAYKDSTPSIIRLKEVTKRVGYKRASIYAKIKSGEFPAPVSLGARAVGWIDSEITEWVRARIVARDGAQ
jgi:prophage regulatory protein